MTEHNDLGAAFKALDREVQLSAPTFAELASSSAMKAARVRRRTHRVSYVAVAAILTSLLLWRSQSAPDFDFERFTRLTGLDPGALSWQAPTDFLLSIPGHELLQAIPTIDVSVPTIRVDSTRTQDTRPTARRSSDS